nr:MAG TPA: hypothetical protein [Caudoviricetes sp.]
MSAICRRFDKKDKNRTRTDIAQLTESYIKLKISLFGEWRCIC